MSGEKITLTEFVNRQSRFGEYKGVFRLIVDRNLPDYSIDPITQLGLLSQADLFLTLWSGNNLMVAEAVCRELKKFGQPVGGNTSTLEYKKERQRRVPISK